jgi:hypothetical protein
MRRFRSSLLRSLPVVAAGALAVCGVFTSTACSSIDSEDIDTDALTADFSVRPRVDGTATEVGATLSAGALTFVDLIGDDRLVARSGDVEADLVESEVLGALSYAVTLDGVGEPGATVTVGFERTAFASASSSTVTLPVPVSITAPEAATVFSRANDDLVISLADDGSTDGVRVSWTGDCVVEDGVDVPAGQTTVTIARGTIQTADASARGDSGGGNGAAAPALDSCALTVVAERVVEGVLDAGFKGGSITATTSDRRELTSNP